MRWVVYGIGMPDMVIGTVIGLCANHHTVTVDTEKLWTLIKMKKNLIEVVSPEFRDRYSYFSAADSEIKLLINIFGDVIINPKLPLRSTASFFFSQTSMQNEAIKDQESQKKYSIS